MVWGRVADLDRQTATKQVLLDPDSSRTKQAPKFMHFSAEISSAMKFIVKPRLAEGLCKVC